MRDFCKKHGQIIKYLFFGVLTTLVGWAVYFAVLFGARAAFSIPTDDTSSVKYLIAYTAAQIIQWIAAVLFAFFTNRRWVFTSAEKSGCTAKQLGIFASGRLLTFLLDYVVTYFGTLLLCAAFEWATSVTLMGREWNLNEIAAKLVSAIIVIIGNYFFSKLLVFREKKETREKK